MRGRRRFAEGNDLVGMDCVELKMSLLERAEQVASSGKVMPCLARLLGEKDEEVERTLVVDRESLGTLPSR